MRYEKINACVSVPFDEDDKDKSVWFLDHDYLENMYGMFKKVNGKERTEFVQMHVDFFFTWRENSDCDILC